MKYISLLFFILLFTPRTVSAAPVSTSSTLLPVVSSERTLVGAPNLVIAPDLEYVAMERALYMKRHHYFSHCNNGSSNEQCPSGYNITRYLPAGKAFGENIGEFIFPSNSAVKYCINNPECRLKMQNLWYHSTPHRENILNKNYHYFGSAEIRDGKKLIYVEIFS